MRFRGGINVLLVLPEVLQIDKSGYRVTGQFEKLNHQHYRQYSANSRNKLYTVEGWQPEVFTAPCLAKQSYLHRYNWLHVHLCEALCLGTLHVSTRQPSIQDL